jgi:hypothetical protein
MKFTGWYSIMVGFLMLAQWGFFLSAGQVPEVKTAPIALGFHLAAEAITALGLILSGIGLLSKTRWGKQLSLASLGMLLYTVIVSPGYFAQQGAWPLVGMFAVLLILAVTSVRTLSRS